MKQQSFIKRIKLSAVVLAAVMMLGTATPAFALPEPVEEDGGPIMVSLGDSYSSGEGVEPFYYAGKSDRFTHPDWLAHRSKQSWPGKLKLTDSTGKQLVMSKNKAYYNSKTKSYDSYSKNNWYFVASSGAVTAHLRGTQNKWFDRDPANESPVEQSCVTLDNQLKVFESIEPGATDYVTMTMGGNDAHFADVFIYAALNCSFINVNGMDDYLGKIWDEFYNGSNSIKNRLIRAYTDIRNAAGSQADIIIAGYPKILPQNGFLVFSAQESASIDNAITGLNQEIKGIVESLYAEDFKIHFVSVEEAFEGHEIYTGVFKEYINGIKLVHEQDLSEAQIISSYSLHPNSKGVKAYAACVQACIDQIEQEKQQASLPETEASLSEEPMPEEEIAPADEFGAGEAVLPEGALKDLGEEAPEGDETLIDLETTEPLPEEGGGEESKLCTLTADLSEIPSLQGAEVYTSENSLCSFPEGTTPVSAQAQLELQLLAGGAQAEICFYKPGHTSLRVVIENICAGQTIDLTDALTAAAEEGQLLTSGDIDLDGSVTEADVIRITAPELFGLPTQEDDALSDLDTDGCISLADIAMLLCTERYGAGERTLTFCAQ